MLRSPSGIRHHLALAALGLAAGAAGAAASAPAPSALQPLQSIRIAAEDYVRAQLPGESRGVHVAAREPDRRLRLPRCAGALETAPLGSAPLEAHVAVRVSCRQGASWTIYVPVTVESEVEVLVLKAPAAAGARLAVADVVHETRREAGLPVEYVTDPGALARHTLRHPLGAGAVLTQDMLLPDLIVRHGEEVTIAAGYDGIAVRTGGKALQDGREGERIRVQNLASLRVIEGVVDADRVIHVTP
jgi:flagellar basal body P-ring formation protein FlgA